MRSAASTIDATSTQSFKIKYKTEVKYFGFLRDSRCVEIGSKLENAGLEIAALLHTVTLNFKKRSTFPQNIKQSFANNITNHSFVPMERDANSFIPQGLSHRAAMERL